jgi:hypothetical protein
MSSKSAEWAWCRVAKAVGWTRSCFKVLKKLSTTALSQQLPFLDMLHWVPREAREI